MKFRNALLLAALCATAMACVLTGPTMPFAMAFFYSALISSFFLAVGYGAVHLHSRPAVGVIAPVHGVAHARVAVPVAKPGVVLNPAPRGFFPGLFGGHRAGVARVAHPVGLGHHHAAPIRVGGIRR